METNFEAHNLELEGVKLITPFYREDNRGYFLKSMEKEVFSKFGIETEIYEEFETYSRKGIIRGLHFQTKDPQAKIVRAVWGTIHDVIVDLRKGSESFGRYISVVLDEKNHDSLYIPAGFAHGFEVLSEESLVSYKCVGKYLKEFDTGICWNDKELAIKWKTANPVVSQKDKKLMTFREFSDKYLGL